MSLGAPEIIGIVVLALLLFGGRKLPELGSSVGKTITNFRKGLSEAKEEEEESGPGAEPGAVAVDPTVTDSTATGPADKA